MSSNTFISSTDGQIVLFLTPGDLAALKQAAAFPFALRYRLSDKEPFVLPSWSPRREALANRYSTEQAQSDYLAYKGIPPLDLPGKSGERFSDYAASASKRHGLLYPRAECRLTGL